MGKKRQVLLAALLVAVLGGLAWFVLRSSAEPVYQGKPLTVWLQRYTRHDSSGPGSSTGPEPEADEAVRYIGAKAIPQLLRMVRADDSSWKWRLSAWAGKHGLIHVTQSTPSGIQNNQAMMAFRTLGPNGSNAVPALIRIYERQASVGTRWVCLDAFSSIGPGAHEAVPLLLKEAVSSTNGFLRSIAVTALGNIHAQPDSVVTVLTNCLADRSPPIRLATARALIKYSVDKQVILPVLTELITNGDFMTRMMARNELINIDPENAWESLVPVLLNEITNPVPMFRQCAFQELTRLGEKAKSAVPALTQALGDPDPMTSAMARFALKAIDPEAAAKAGVK